MIKIISQEFLENNKAIKSVDVYIFGVRVYKSLDTTTNKLIIDSLTPYKQITKVKGF